MYQYFFFVTSAEERRRLEQGLERLLRQLEVLRLQEENEAARRVNERYIKCLDTLKDWGGNAKRYK